MYDVLVITFLSGLPGLRLGSNILGGLLFDFMLINLFTFVFGFVPLAMILAN